MTSCCFALAFLFIVGSWYTLLVPGIMHGIHAQTCLARFDVKGG